MKAKLSFEGRGVSDAFWLTLALAVLGGVILATTTVLRGYSWEELGSYGDAPDYLQQARTFGPGLHHMPLYGWTVGALHLMMFRIPAIEAVGVAVSLTSLILTAHTIRSVLRLDRISSRRVPWIVLALSLFPPRHFVYATRILADNMAFLFVALGYLFLRKGQGHHANLCLCGAALTHDFAAILWITAAMDHVRRRAWTPLISSPLIFLPTLALILVRMLSPDGISRLLYEGRPIFTLPLFGLLTPPFDQPWLNVGFYGSFATYGIIYGWALYWCARRGTRQAFWFSLVPFLVLLCLREYVLYYSFDRFLVLSFPAVLQLLSKTDFSGFRTRIIVAYYALVCLVSTAYFVLSFPSSDVHKRFPRNSESGSQVGHFLKIAHGSDVPNITSILHPAESYAVPSSATRLHRNCELCAGWKRSRSLRRMERG